MRFCKEGALHESVLELDGPRRAISHGLGCIVAVGDLDDVTKESQSWQPGRDLRSFGGARLGRMALRYRRGV